MFPGVLAREAGYCLINTEKRRGRRICWVSGFCFSLRLWRSFDDLYVFLCSGCGEILRAMDMQHACHASHHVRRAQELARGI